MGAAAGPRVRQRRLRVAPAVRQVALLAVLLGLPIVARPCLVPRRPGQQRFSGPELAIITLLLLLGGGLFWCYERASEAPTDRSRHGQRGHRVVTADRIRPSIAVLPFENRSREADDAFFVDGIHDDILTQLSKVSALRVISRTSVEQFRDTKLPVKAIADQLGVTKILEGGVQRAGDRVRINVQLIDAPAMRISGRRATTASSRPPTSSPSRASLPVQSLAL